MLMAEFSAAIVQRCV